MVEAMVASVVWSVVWCLVPLGLLGGIVVVAVNWARKGPQAVSIDLGRSYFYLIAFLTLLFLFFGLTQLVSSGVALALGTPAQGDDYDVWTGSSVPAEEAVRRDLAMAAAAVVVSAPVWLFHWRRSRATGNGNGSNLSRLYMYSVLSLLLLGGLIFAGTFVFQILGLPLGLVDPSARQELLSLVRDMASAGLSALIALLFWVYHWRALEASPPPALEPA